jgi:RNA polymerase sigma factor (sigma-70 family)
MGAKKPSLLSVADRNALVEQWLFLPARVFRSLSHIPRVRTMGKDEAEQIGFVAMIRAAELWDDRREKFVTYAYRCIYCQLMQNASDQGVIHVPQHIRSPAKNRPPTVEERFCAERANRVTSLARGESSYRTDQKEGRVFDLPDTKTVEHDRREQLDAVRTAADRLRPELRDAIVSHYFQGENLRSIASDVGLTHQAIHQRTATAKAELLELLMKKMFNGICAACQVLQPRCVAVFLRLSGNGKRYAKCPTTLCETCRKNGTYRGKFIVSDRHK